MASRKSVIYTLIYKYRGTCTTGTVDFSRIRSREHALEEESRRDGSLASRVPYT